MCHLIGGTGALYIVDSNNYRIVRYCSGIYSGSVVIVNNSLGVSNTQLWTSTEIYFDSPTNSLIIANLGTNNIVRWVLGDTHWIITAGDRNGSSGITSTELNSPRSVTLDPMGNIYVVDTLDSRIQCFVNDQTGSPENSLNKLKNPSKSLLDSQLHLYVADTDDQRVRKFARYSTSPIEEKTF